MNASVNYGSSRKGRCIRRITWTLHDLGEAIAQVLSVDGAFSQWLHRHIPEGDRL